MSLLTVLLVTLFVTTYSFNWNRKFQLADLSQAIGPLKKPADEKDDQHQQQPIQGQHLTLPPLYGYDFKNLMAQAILKPKKASKKKAHRGGKLMSFIPQFKLPKLVMKPLGSQEIKRPVMKPALPLLPKPDSGFLENKPIKSIAVPEIIPGGEFPFKLQQSKPTWLMAIEELRAETCTTQTYNRTITSKGCKSIEIQSKYCTGRCNSFFVPSLTNDFQSCSSCFPSKHNTITLLLDCPGRKRGYKLKQVRVIKECKCQSVMECPHY
eukprot:gene17322-19055_t